MRTLCVPPAMRAPAPAPGGADSEVLKGSSDTNGSNANGSNANGSNVPWHVDGLDLVVPPALCRPAPAPRPPPPSIPY
jgi:hypothetical protein